MVAKVTMKLSMLAREAGFLVSRGDDLYEIKKMYAERMIYSKYCDQHDMRLGEALGMSNMSKEDLQKFLKC